MRLFGVGKRDKRTAKVSVVVPVYNGEKSLRQCIDSILGQTLLDIEIICVDDGSTDASPAILEEYKRSDSRIKVIRQQNLYAGVARNNGMKQANGKYLVFWDCDDFFEPDALQLMYEKISSVDADICVCGAFQYQEEKNNSIQSVSYLRKRRVPQADTFNRTTNEKYILNFTTAVPWNKMFRKGFVEKNSLLFEPIRNANDVRFTVSALCLAEKITTVDKPLVHYRTHKDTGLVSTIDDAWEAPINTWIDTARDLKSRGAFPERSFANKAFSSLLYNIRIMRKYDSQLGAVKLLKDGGLSEMEILPREGGYYYNSDHEKLVSAIWELSAEDFLAYLLHITYTQVQKANLRAQEAERSKR